jgi:hypothetical protein
MDDSSSYMECDTVSAPMLLSVNQVGGKHLRDELSNAKKMRKSDGVWLQPSTLLCIVSVAQPAEADAQGARACTWDITDVLGFNNADVVLF